VQKTPRICAVIPAKDVSRSIANVLSQAYRAGVTHVVVVINGCTDDTLRQTKRTLLHLAMANHILHFTPALGPDVPRAVGTYEALRTFRDLDWFLYVDGDWSGGFGPMLAESVAQASQTGADMQFSRRSYSTNHSDLWLPNTVGLDIQTGLKQAVLSPTRLDYQVWDQAVLREIPPFTQMAPSEAPFAVHRRVFRRLSPYWLYHPGIWFAMAVQQSHRGLTIGVSESWTGKWTGNPSPTSQHARATADTLIGDALEGARILQHQRPHRILRGILFDGYDSSRRTDVLKRWQSQLHTDI